ncbi:m-AAA protease-interacting protein 1, mitochondrial-like [Macrosteles quadrilineatus]|uniref:m-AAA protease-interacting protein 1, mitochondrial-like n=1 Tax=Macrosteles quadrilineatus TaxID=74068 RepID=UPI0023E1D4AF|nr:m-AAA protease-interacting protein 1, mitochondrial-like [Macrosteles quadrilineatus]
MHIIMCHKAALELAVRLNSNTFKFSILSKYCNLSSTNYEANKLVLSNVTRKFSALVPQQYQYKNNDTSQIASLNLLSESSVNNRSYCSKRERELPKIMQFPQVVWPSVFKTIRNWVLSNFIIMRYFDSDFSLPNFVNGSKQAVEIVSGFIAKGDVDSLVGLVTPEVITQVRETMQTLSLKERQEFAIRQDDIFFCFPYEVGVMFPNEDKNEGENQSRFVEITMCYHALLGLRELRESGTEIPINIGVQPEFSDKIFVLNYRFIREFTKGVQDDWTINAINHFKPSVHM